MTQTLFTKNFTLLILGQATSLFGNFILKLALSMYILEITGSATIFAAIVSLAIIPNIFMVPLGGILADRANKKKIMVVLDMLTGLSVLCTSLFLSNGNDITIISILLVILSILGAFETPTVQSCIPIMLTGDNITKGNAVVNQIASLSYLIAPMLGSIFYTAFGIFTVMYISIICFFITALFECFIKLNHQPFYYGKNILLIVKQDFLLSIQYIFKKQKDILNILLFIAFSRFFVMGITIVGLPYIIRSVLGLNAQYYGAAETMLAIATILGSVITGFISETFKIHKLSFIFASLGIFIILSGISFIFPVTVILKYTMCMISFCAMQIAINIFSIFAISIIQQRTPNNFIGKIMAYTSSITLCAQPIGQIVYGFLFDKFTNMIFIILIPTGIIVSIIGLSSQTFFRNIENETVAK